MPITMLNNSSIRLLLSSTAGKKFGTRSAGNSPLRRPNPTLRRTLPSGTESSEHLPSTSKGGSLLDKQFQLRQFHGSKYRVSFQLLEIMKKWSIFIQ